MKKILSILTIVVLATFFSCSNDEPITTKKETLSAKSLSEEPETYIDNIDYSLIEDKYPDTNISILEEQLYQISMGNITPVCSKSFFFTDSYYNESWRADTTVFDVGFGFCIQRNRMSLWWKIDEETPGWWHYSYTTYTISVNCQCENPR